MMLDEGPHGTEAAYMCIRGDVHVEDTSKPKSRIEVGGNIKA